MNNNKKIKIGIDINEILRARWLQFDRYYSQEFGDEGIPEEQPYVYDFFKHYKWEDTIETIKDLKEPENMPENINPIDYQIDKKTGEAPADFAIFKLPEKIKLTANEVYNRFMYEDYVFEIHAAATMMYRGMDLHVKNFYLKYKDCVDFVLLSKENMFSIPSTLLFLSKITSRFNNYYFVDEVQDMWKHVDILITTDPEILDAETPKDKTIIKLIRPYNEKCQDGSIKQLLQLNDLVDNQEFEKIIKYKK